MIGGIDSGYSFFLVTLVSWLLGSSLILTFHSVSARLNVKICDAVSSIIVSWKNSNYYTTFSVSKGVIQRKKESWSSVTSSPNDKQIDPALWLWKSKQG